MVEKLVRCKMGVVYMERRTESGKNWIKSLWPTFQKAYAKTQEIVLTVPPSGRPIPSGSCPKKVSWKSVDGQNQRGRKRDLLSRVHYTCIIYRFLSKKMKVSILAYAVRVVPLGWRPQCGSVCTPQGTCVCVCSGRRQKMTPDLYLFCI